MGRASGRSLLSPTSPPVDPPCAPLLGLFPAGFTPFKAATCHRNSAPSSPRSRTGSRARPPDLGATSKTAPGRIVIRGAASAQEHLPGVRPRCRRQRRHSPGDRHDVRRLTRRASARLARALKSLLRVVLHSEDPHEVGASVTTHAEKRHRLARPLDRPAERKAEVEGRVVERVIEGEHLVIPDLAGECGYMF